MHSREQSGVRSPMPLRGVARWLDMLVRVPQWLRATVPAFGMLILWWSSSRIPGSEPQTTAGALFHNSMHIVAYGCLAAAFWIAWSRQPIDAPQAFRSRGAWLLAVLYGVVDELHQSFVPGRVCSFSDLLSDASGAALAVVVLRGLSGRSPRWGKLAGLLVLASIASVATATFAGW